MTGPLEVLCQRPGCGDPYRRHAPGGGHCRVCDCPGMRWVALESDGGQHVGSYAGPPSARHIGQASTPHSGDGTFPAG